MDRFNHNYDHAETQADTDTGNFMDGVITGLCLSFILWALILGVISHVFQLGW